MIVQSAGAAGATDISFTLSKDELSKASAALEPVVKEIGAAGIKAQDGIAKLSIVGIGMRSHSGVAAKLFEALSSGGINIQMISTSEIKTAVILEEGRIAEAANLVHAAFGLGYDNKTISTADSDGVMYAAIQGLVEELKDRDAKIGELEAIGAGLKAKMEAMEERLNSLPPAR